MDLFNISNLICLKSHVLGYCVNEEFSSMWINFAFKAQQITTKRIKILTETILIQFLFYKFLAQLPESVTDSGRVRKTLDYKYLCVYYVRTVYLNSLRLEWEHTLIRRQVS